MKTYLPKVDEITPEWFVVDAEGKTVGHLAVKIANIIRGRHKPTYTPHLDTGDFVVVVNADKVVFSGNKEDQKIYQDYSGWMGGQKEQLAKVVRAKKPTRLLEQAVKGMVPRTRLGRQQLHKLKIYAGSAHPHAAQTPQKLEL
jgi:large subunit ribosomal protein L13